MNSLKCYVLALGALALINTTRAGSTASVNTEELPLRLVLELVDGTHVIGTPSIESVSVQTSYAKLDVPLKQILAIRINPDHETVSIDLLNGDKLTGVITLAPLQLTTIFGEVSVVVEHVTRISVRRSGAAEALVLHYSFDKDEGDIVTDQSGSGNDGKVNQAKWTAKGKVGGAYDFSGNDSANVSFDPKPLAGSRAVTVAAWFKSYGDPGDWEQIIGCSTEAGNIQTPVSFLWFNKTGLGNNAHTRLLIDKEGGGRESFAIVSTKPTTYFRNGDWHYVVLTWDGSKATHYVDGVPDASQATAAGALAYADDRRSLIGNGWAFGKATHNFNGLIDEVRIYSRALPESEIREIYANPRNSTGRFAR